MKTWDVRGVVASEEWFNTMCCRVCNHYLLEINFSKNNPKNDYKYKIV